MSKSGRAAAFLWVGMIVAVGLAWAGMARADSLALVSGSGQSGLIGQPGAHPIVVQARNVNGVAIAGKTIHWSTSNGFQVSAPTSVTDANGNASINFTYGNYGTTSIIASDPVTGTSANASANSLGSDSLVLISGGGQVGQAGSASSQPLVVEIRNAAGAPISGRAVNWADQSAYTHVNATTSVSDASGRASMGFSFVEGPAVFAGTPADITATNSVGGQVVTATVTELGANLLTITSPLQVTGLVGQTSPPIVAHVADWQGNPIAGATVTWTTSQPGLFNLSSASTVTDVAGNTSITAFYVGSTGDDFITAAYNGTSEDVHFYLQTQTHMDVVSANPVIGSPNAASPTPLVIQDFNKDGTPRVGDTITWTVESGDAVPNAATSVTDATGTATMGFTFGTGLTQFLATDSRGASRGLLANPSVSGQSVQYVSGAGQTGSSLSAATSPVVMKVVDQAGVPQPGVTVNWTQYSLGTNGYPGSVVYTSPTTTVSDSAGLVQATFNFAAVGKVAIRAELPSTLGSGAVVTSYGTETLTLLSGDRQSGLVGTHSAQPLVVVFRDAAGNPLSGQTINWSVFAGGNAILDAATSVTDAAGHASMGFTYATTASASQIEAAGTSGNPVSGPIIADALVTGVGADSLTSIAGSGQSGIEGFVAAIPLEVEVRDPAGALVSGRLINWSVASGGAIPFGPSSSTNGTGRAQMGFSYGNGASTIVATDSVTGKSTSFAVNAVSQQGSAKFISGDGQSGLPGTNAAQPLVLEVRDAGNVPDPTASIVWSVVSGPAVILTSSNATDANGQASATFNYGATPGTSIIQAKDATNPNGQFIQATVTSLSSNQTLAIVDGSDQVLVTAAPSLPLVVQLKDFAGVPVSGATVSWSATNGTMTSASSTTDAQGKASNTVTATAAGPVQVTANSQLAASSAVFTFNSSLAALPNLTPEEAATAVAIDNACPALAAKASLSPQEADLLARCQELSNAATLDPNATSQALGELVSDTAQAQSTAAMTAVTAQVINVRTRLLALRSSSPTNSLSGLTFTAAGGTIALPSLLSALGDEKPPGTTDDVLNSPWGFFASGNIGRGEQKEGRAGPAFDYDIEGLTAGVDYRFNEDWVAGGALGYTHQDTDLDHDQGQVALQGWSLSFYGTHNFHKDWYVDGVITTGRNQYKLERNIDYTVPLAGGGETHVQQQAVGKPDGDLLSAALTFGGDLHRQSFNFSPYGQLVYARIGFDAYTEDLHSGLGSGLGLSVDSRNVTGLTGILGARASWANSADWGVWTPTLMMEWNHEFHDELDGVTAHFTYDPTGTSIHVGGEPVDTDYLRFGFGLSFLLPHGRSGFFLYDRTFAQDRQLQENLSLGIRIEF